MDWLIQKATELGVAAFLPLVSERTVVRLGTAAAEARRQRWQKIAVQACEQSGRTRVPTVELPRTYDEWIHSLAAAPAVMVYEGEHETSLHSALQRHGNWATMVLLIGPEGGFSEREVAVAREQGVVTAHLGPRVLRAETAGLVAVALVLSHLGELR
jgi:16S rRNA (uracil1498-N3)-methyltransferase